MSAVVKLGDVATVIAGQSPPGSSYNEVGEGLPFFQGKAEFGDVSPKPRKWCTEPVKIANAGDILISVRAPVGPTNIAPTRCCIGRGLAAIRPRSENLLRDYIHWIIRIKEPFLVSKGQGSTFPAINQGDLNGLEFPLPPLDEQRRIVDILNRAERIRRLRDAAAATRRAFIPALFLKMFGDPIENPMGWDVRPLGELLSVGPQNGLYKPKSAYGDGTRILRIDGFYDGKVIDPTRWHRLRLSPAEQETYGLRADDIVVNRVNSLPYLGKSAIIPAMSEPAVFESNMMRLTVDRTALLPLYVIALLQVPAVLGALRTKAKAAINQASINQGDVCSIPTPVPPLAVQERFVRLASAAESVAATAETAAAPAASLMDTLMSRLFGEAA